MSDKKHRLQFDFTLPQVARLDALVDAYEERLLIL